MINFKTCCRLAAAVALFALPASASAATFKAVQSGTATSSSNGTTTVTITAVDTTKSFLIFQTRSDSNRPVGSMVRGRIASSTTLEFVRVTDETSTINIQWFVVEYASGVKVQRGSMTETAATVNTSITPVSAVNQAFVTWSKTPVTADYNWGNDDPVVLELTSTSNLQMRTNFESSNHIIWWQVIEYTNSTDILVQKGSTSLTGTTTSVDVTLGTSINASKAFVLVGFQNAAGSLSSIGRRFVRARLIGSSKIRIDRDVADAGDTLDEIAWQVVELRDGSSVQSGTVSFSSGNSQQTVSISSVDTTRAIAFGSAQPAAGQCMGKTPYVGDDIPGVASATLALSSTSFTARRNNTAATADIGWFVVEFPDPCAAPTTPRANIVFVVPNANSLNTSDAAKRCAMYSWNLGVSLISETANTNQFNSAIASAQAVYVSAGVSASTVASKLADQNIGIVWEVPGLDDDFQLTNADGGTVSGTAINIVNACHYITSPFGTGNRTIMSSSQMLATASTTIADDAIKLAQRTSSSTPVLVAIERRNQSYGGSRSKGRRVHLPWGASSFDYTLLTSDGQTLMQRAIEWAAGADSSMGTWYLDEIAGTTATDSSANGRTATLTSMDPATDWVKGRVDNALDFDGTDDRAIVAGTFTPPTSGTVAFFMQVPGAPISHGRIFGSGGDWEVRHVQSGNPDGVANGIVFDLNFPATGGANNVFCTTVPISTAGRWYHIAAVYNQPAGTYSVYIDGALHKSGTTSLVLDAPGTLTIGTRTGSTEYFVGKLDDLRIYDRELCIDEIAALARQRTTIRIIQWAEVRNMP